MIASISGEVIELGPDSVLVETVGIGYEILVPASVLSDIKPGANIKLLTYHHVRENGQELFGFVENGQKNLFKLLLGVSGIGPRSALAVMSLGEHEQIRKAIAAGNVAYIAGAAGIGKKIAERITVELKDKVGVLGGEFATADELAADDAQAALLALGYSAAQAARALGPVDTSLTTEEKVRQALKELS